MREIPNGMRLPYRFGTEGHEHTIYYEYMGSGKWINLETSQYASGGVKRELDQDAELQLRALQTAQSQGMKNYPR